MFSSWNCASLSFLGFLFLIEDYVLFGAEFLFKHALQIGHLLLQ